MDNSYHLLQIEEIYKTTPAQDGFNAKLKNGETVSISGTAWNTDDNKKQRDNNICFILPDGREAYVPQEIEEKINKLLTSN